MPLTISQIAEEPHLVTSTVLVSDGEEFCLRPLEVGDAPVLASFLQGLSEATRTFSHFPSYDLVCAEELCGAVGRYDKLRLVIESESSEAVGLIELSLGLPEADIARFAAAHIELSEASDCRFGPTLADAYQERGLGSRAFPLILEIVRRLGRTRLILLGGVREENERARHFYRKFGFAEVGSFDGLSGAKNVDMILDLQA